ASDSASRAISELAPTANAPERAVLLSSRIGRSMLAAGQTRRTLMGPYGDASSGGRRRGLKLWPILLFGVYLAYYWFSHQDTTSYTGRKDLVETSPHPAGARAMQPPRQ